jgi:hypothetical protein
MSGFMLLPPRKDLCQECATAHELEQPHNQQSLHYQYHFRAQHGRWPTWRDALAHCDEETRKLWEEELRVLGAWDGWSGDTPPVPDVLPEPDGTIGTVAPVPIQATKKPQKKRRRHG